jgi:hypothetical protein
MRVGELGSLDLAAGTDMLGVNVAAAMPLASACPAKGEFVLLATATPMLVDSNRGSVPRVSPVRPEEIAATTAFLSSEEAAAIAGQQLVTCGGSFSVICRATRGKPRIQAPQQLNHIGRL